MSDFKGRHFRGEIVLWAVRWYCRYPVSYRDLEAMMTERGVAVDHSRSIVGCSVSRRRWRNVCAGSGAGHSRGVGASTRPTSRSVASGRICTGRGQAREHDRFLSLGDPQHQGSEAISRQGAERIEEWEQSEVLNTDKAPAYAAAIAELKAEGKCPKDTRHRQVKYLNNVIEADHGKLKLLIRPVRGCSRR